MSFRKPLAPVSKFWGSKEEINKSLIIICRYLKKIYLSMCLYEQVVWKKSYSFLLLTIWVDTYTLQIDYWPWRNRW